MARNYDIEVARHILAAQISSDCGKDEHFRSYFLDSDFYYRLKDRNILEAIRKIARSNSGVYRFSVQDGEITPFLVYFTIKIPGEKILQVSFHSFCSGLKRYMKSTTKTSWDKNNSREAAIKCAKYFNVVKKSVADSESSRWWAYYYLNR